MLVVSPTSSASASPAVPKATRNIAIVSSVLGAAIIVLLALVIRLYVELRRMRRTRIVEAEWMGRSRDSMSSAKRRRKDSKETAMMESEFGEFASLNGSTFKRGNGAARTFSTSSSSEAGRTESSLSMVDDKSSLFSSYYRPNSPPVTASPLAAVVRFEAPRTIKSTDPAEPRGRSETPRPISRSQSIFSAEDNPQAGSAAGSKEDVSTRALYLERFSTDATSPRLSTLDRQIDISEGLRFGRVTSKSPRPTPHFIFSFLTSHSHNMLRSVQSLRRSLPTLRVAFAARPMGTSTKFTGKKTDSPESKPNAGYPKGSHSAPAKTESEEVVRRALLTDIFSCVANEFQSPLQVKAGDHDKSPADLLKDSARTPAENQIQGYHAIRGVPDSPTSGWVVAR
ncbi:hypothetical protein P7C70_g3461, partial [Phenoliferia sp. Uapishka_3]